MRLYRCAPGFWGLGLSHSPGHWHVQIGPWVLTTEPGEEGRCL